ncbi:MAG: FkbM family methyltransferase [Solirubrobacteraceae bacterium]
MPRHDIAAHGAEGNVDQAVLTRFFPGQQSGVLVEVGAAHPAYLSVGALYRRLGWRVFAIEPNPEFCELHRAQGHEVLQFACGDHDEDSVNFSVVDSRGAEYEGGRVSYESFSSLGIKSSYADLLDPALSIRSIKVDLRRLDTLLQEYAPTLERIDIVAVDVEGWELEVLDGLDMRTADRAKARGRRLIAAAAAGLQSDRRSIQDPQDPPGPELAGGRRR